MTDDKWIFLHVIKRNYGIVILSDSMAIVAITSDLRIWISSGWKGHKRARIPVYNT